MVRTEFLRLAEGYPTSPDWRGDTFKGSPVIQLLTTELPAAMIRAIPAAGGRYEVEGSAGQSTWTHTPWVAVLDPGVTETVQEGYYVVYLLSLGGERLYLSINQGCTSLMKSEGIPGARDELFGERKRCGPESRTTPND
jgi:5-methylcytosine-specific restriction enzyme A